MSTTVTVDLDLAYERTASGQSEVWGGQLPLDLTERRALALFNGFTPTTDLQAIVGEHHLPAMVLERLLNLGLIRSTRTAGGPEKTLNGIGWRVQVPL